MIVFLVFAVWTNNRRWANQQPKSSVGFTEGLFEPILLFLSPDRFPGIVRSGVWRAKISAFYEPDLQVFAPTIRSVGLFSHGNLLLEDIKALLEGELVHGRSIHGRPAVIDPCIVVVLDEIRGHLLVKLNVGWAGVHALPMPVGEFFGFSQSVIIEDVSCVDKEVWTL